MNSADKAILRPLAERYSELAHRDIQQERLRRYRAHNDLEIVRPIVLVDEVPWGEIADEALVCRCSPEFAGMERGIRRALFAWDHFQADMVIGPVYLVDKRAKRLRGIGLEAADTALRGETGTSIAAHQYEDLLKTEADLDALHPPEIVADPEGTEVAVARAAEVFDGLMEVAVTGGGLHYNLWDVISRYRGVDPLLLDLAVRPEFMHRTVAKFAEIAESTFTQLEEQGLLGCDRPLLHCTPACTGDLPAADFAGTYRRRDVWGRCAAQIFGSVSPQMHDEFDLVYNEKLFGECGLVYYGCCEPMDRKIDLLRKRFRNLRKVSITPWADPKRAAEAIGGDFVLAAKPNPAFVARPAFNPEPVEAEIAAYCEACRESGSPLEFVIKDISTIANNVENLTRWCETVQGVIDRYYG